MRALTAVPVVPLTVAAAGAAGGGGRRGLAPPLGHH